MLGKRWQKTYNYSEGYRGRKYTTIPDSASVFGFAQGDDTTVPQQGSRYIPRQLLQYYTLPIILLLPVRVLTCAIEYRVCRITQRPPTCLSTRRAKRGRPPVPVDVRKLNGRQKPRLLLPQQPLPHLMKNLSL